MIKTMKNTILKFQFLIFMCTFSMSMLIVCCDGMKTELDINSIAFPPKLCVTAILDGGSGTFSIVITEGRALADYKNPRLPEKEIIRNGEIRLYEDDKPILSEVGVFNLGDIYDDPNATYSYRPQRGHRFEAAGIVTHPGKTYRLEVEVNGYKTVTSTSVMPTLSAVSATINTSVIVKKEMIKEYNSLSGWSMSSYSSNNYYWPISLQWGERPAGRNYYALEMFKDEMVMDNDDWITNRENCEILVGDLSKLQDNPEVVAFEGQEIDIDVSSKNYDLYQFPILLMSDMGFTNDNSSLTLYKTLIHFRDDGYNPPPYIKSITLRVRHITEATFKYYRSLLMQSLGMDFFTEPVNIIGNIENGYGGFMVYSAVDIQLLDFSTLIFHGNDSLL